MAPPLYVGVAGITSRKQADDVIDAIPPGFPRQIAIGVLASAKSLAGVKNAWHRRYPAPEAIDGIFSDDPRCLNLIHYCADSPPTEDAIDVCFMRWTDCHGFQFNGENYLLPVDSADPTSAEALTSKALRLNEVITRFASRDQRVRNSSELASNAWNSSASPAGAMRSSSRSMAR